MMEHVKYLHTYTTSHTNAQERQLNDNAIVCFIRSFDYAKDVEQHFDTLITLRQSLSTGIQSDDITAEILQQVLYLAIRTHKWIHGKHNQQTTAFIQACLSFVSSQLPTVHDIAKRLNVYTIAISTSLMTGMQKDAVRFLKQCVNVIASTTASQRIDDQSFVNVICGLSFLLLMLPPPNNPSKSQLYYVSTFIHTIIEYDCWTPGTSYRVDALLSLLRLARNIRNASTINFDSCRDECYELMDKIINVVMDEIGISFSKDPIKEAEFYLQLVNQLLDQMDIDVDRDRDRDNILSVITRCIEKVTPAASKNNQISDKLNDTIQRIQQHDGLSQLKKELYIVPS
jgi:hypothetical protein